MPFFGLSVGIPALKKWGGYPIFRSILRRVGGGQKRAFFGPLFGPPFFGVFGGPFWGPFLGPFWDLLDFLGSRQPITKPRRGFVIER